MTIDAILMVLEHLNNLTPYEYDSSIVVNIDNCVYNCDIVEDIIHITNEHYHFVACYTCDERDSFMACSIGYEHDFRVSEYIPTIYTPELYLDKDYYFQQQTVTEYASMYHLCITIITKWNILWQNQNQ